MKRRLLYSVLILSLVLSLTVSAGFAAPSAAVAHRALGTIMPAGPHLVRPSIEAVTNALKKDGVVAANADKATVDSAVAAYYAKFDKSSSDWVNPVIQKKILDHEQATTNGRAPQVDQTPVAVDVKVFALAVQFGAVSEKFTNTCTPPVEITASGPMQGTITPPLPADNNTLYYTPAQTASTDFYSDLIFGYKGVGRVRSDLRDPKDGQPGINLAGYTVQDYYDNFAGKGNVSLEGSVNGWVSVNHSEAYYGYDCDPTDGINDGEGAVPVGQLVPDAVATFQAAHPGYYTDTSAGAFWPQFDQNQDGFIDAMWIIHAGRGQEAGGGAQGDAAIWSHSWSLSGNGLTPYKVYEGNPATEADDIYIDPYTMQPEDSDLGVMVEEFGHNFFGLPDLYTTDATNSVGFWSEMSGGSWGGPLGGTVPVGMPLWFRMLAWCDTGPCNWQYPMLVRGYKDAAQDVTLGALDGFPGGSSVYKGVRVNLPPVMVAVINKTTGTGKAAYSGVSVGNMDQQFSRDIVIPADATGVLSFKSYSDTELDYDYAYVRVKVAGAADSTYVALADMDGYAITAPLGKGYTGVNKHTLRFDLAAYKGQTITLNLRIVTDPAVNNEGWWVDDVMLDAALLNDFEAAVGENFAGWTNDPNLPWIVAPFQKPYPNYYLLEWRADTKYDSSLKTAYVTTDSGTDLWKVERATYNIPGALLYYRDTRFSEGYSQRQNYGQGPSYGPKNKILVVDMNNQPMRLFNPDNGLAANWLANLSNRAAAYDAALTLQPTQPLDFSAVFLGGAVYPGPFKFPAEPAVTTFNDGKGYYPGFFYEADPDACGGICYTNRDGSVVIPARGTYSTKITDFIGNPFYPYYGLTMGILGPSRFGSGNPADDNMQYGVNIDLLSKSADGLTGVVRVRNYSADVVSTNVETRTLVNGLGVTYKTVVVNNGTETVKNVRLTYNLDPELTFLSFEGATGAVGVAPRAVDGMVKVYNIPSLAPGENLTVTLKTRYTPTVSDGARMKKIDSVATTLEINDGQMVRGPFTMTTPMGPMNLYIFPFLQVH